MTEPHNWHSALDLQMDASRFYNTDGGRKLATYYFASLFTDGFQIGGIENVRAAGQMGYEFQHALYQADTIFLTKDVQALVMAAAESLPPDVVIDQHDFLTPKGFLVLEEPLYGLDGNGKVMSFGAMLWSVLPNESKSDIIVINFLALAHDMKDDVNREILPKLRTEGLPVPPLQINHCYPCRDGSVLPVAGDDPTEQIVPELLRFFVAMNLLAQQEITSKVQMRGDRATRRRMKRAKLPEKTVAVITLRHKRSANKKTKDVDWSHRWIVRGFWRRQWYPSREAHAWKYIHEYVKGPQDKPLVISERRIFDFRR